MTNTKQPEALRLADAIDPPQIACLPETRAVAATELRRLHEEVKYIPALERVLDKQAAEILRLYEENKRLLAANKDSTNHFDALMADHKKLQNENETFKKCLFQMQNAAIELAKPEQEPVAWMWEDRTVTTDPDRADGTWIPLYTAPPKREWVGLHLDDIPETYAGDKSFLNIARWAEAKLKEKNT